MIAHAGALMLAEGLSSDVRMTPYSRAPDLRRGKILEARPVSRPRS